MKRALLIVLGVLLLLGGLALTGAGAALAALVGPDDSISTAPARATGSGVALVAEDITVDESNVPIPSGVGTLSLQVSAPDHRAMFVGTATSANVDTYLTGAPYDVVVELTSGETAKTRRVPGTQQPAPPGTQSFWVTKASGPTATLTSALTSSTTVVVMNADASPAVTADIVVTFTVAHAWVGSLIAVGVGLVLVILAFVAFWRARRAGRKAREAALSASAPSVPEAWPFPAVAPTGAVAPEVAAGPEVVAGPAVAAVPVAAAVTVAALGSDPEPAPAGVPVAEPEPESEVIAEAVAEPSDAAAPVDVPAWAGAAGPDTLTGLEQWAPPVGGDTEAAAAAAAIVGAGVVAGESGDDDGESREPVGTDPDLTADLPVVETVAAPTSDDPMYTELSSWFREGSDDPGR